MKKVSPSRPIQVNENRPIYIPDCIDVPNDSGVSEEDFYAAQRRVLGFLGSPPLSFSEMFPPRFLLW